MTTTDPVLLFVKPKALNPTDKSALRKAGVIVIETENPTEIKFTRASSEISGDKLLMAVMKAVRNYKSDYLGRAVMEAIFDSVTPPPSQGIGEP